MLACSLVGIFCEARKLYMVTEFISGGTLLDLIKDKGRPFSWGLRCKLAMEVASGGAYIHSQGVIHRDFKVSYSSKG